MRLRAFFSLLLLAAVTACTHKTHHIRGVPSIAPPCDDGDNASPTGEGHHDKPCKGDDD